MMNKSMLIGIVAGVAIATAGGVAAYQYLGQSAQDGQQGSNVVDETAPSEAAPAVATAQPAPAPARAQAPAPAPRPAAPAPKPAAPAPQPVAAADPAPAPCQAPKDEHQIAGTALGAVVGGAVARDVGDRNLTTAVGAAAGAFIGKKIQQKIQDKNAGSGCTPASH